MTRHLPRSLSIAVALVLALVPLAAWAEPPERSLVIPSRDAAVKTVGGPVEGAGTSGAMAVGQPVKIARSGIYTVVVRAWGSPAQNVWPEMALLVDELEVATAEVKRGTAADFRFEIELKEGVHEVAAGFLNDSKLGDEDRNLYLESITITAPPGSPAPVSVAAAASDPEAAARRERAIVDATAAAIEKNRKSDAVVQVVDPSGRPIPGARVTIVQTSHEFLFGCNIYGFDHSRTEAQNAAYKERFAGLFNYATVGFYWRSYEPRRGRPRYAETDKIVAWCAEHGIRMKGHPLLWGDENGIPLWSKGQPASEVQRDRVRAIMTRYRGKIGFYEVVNEPSHLATPRIDEPYRWAREADPAAYLIVNDYHVLADGAPRFFRLLKRAIEDGVPFDGIGIQAHEPRTMRFPLDRVRSVLDRYATLGKELHITEFTPASNGERITGSHLKGVWDEAAQADYAEKFYRVCFAHPALRGITWWDLSDQHSWLKGGGMLHADMTPKPVYERLRKLIREEWTTRLETQTDAAGRLALRGFLGGYQLSVKTDGKTLEGTFTIRKGAPNEQRVEVRNTAPPNS